MGILPTSFLANKPSGLLMEIGREPAFSQIGYPVSPKRLGIAKSPRRDLEVSQRYVGLEARLDTIQAAILLVKLKPTRRS